MWISLRSRAAFASAAFTSTSTNNDDDFARDGEQDSARDNGLVNIDADVTSEGGVGGTEQAIGGGVLDIHVAEPKPGEHTSGVNARGDP